MHIARVRRSAIAEESAAIWRPVKLKDAFVPLEVLDAQTDAWRALRLQVRNKLSNSSFEALALRWAELPPVAEKVLVRFVGRHYWPLPSEGI